ncbi:MAG: RNA polymerase subunit sigma-70 [Gammaproteobacteria bacterium]|nr:MAG: RNA polymerase subunit sigma-70 [Gammaproteobacteria bacterium]
MIAAAEGAHADAHRTIERAARDSYGRLVAFLAARSRDVAAAEDALADAFRIALETWPRDGVPNQPEAWLLTAGRRRLLDQMRHAQVQIAALPELIAAANEAQNMIATGLTFPDERLKLMFICAHPAIDAAARTPLMLQTVLGLDAARIASAFLVKPAAMGTRLSRAKGKIRDAHIAFELPQSDDLPERLDAVLEAIYAAYGSGWDDVAGADPRRKGLAAEAIDLGRALLRLLPNEPEVSGLLALMLYCESRRAARRCARGEYVSLSEQDTALWSSDLIDEAGMLIDAASRARHLGRFQLEAAIQSVHAHRRSSGRIDWQAIALFYEALVRIAPTTGSLVGRAAAAAEALGADAGWNLLETIPADAVANYQSYWALAAHLLARMQRHDEARAAYDRAIGLCTDAATRGFLQQRAAALR